MKMEVSNDTVRITGINELGAANSGAFRDWVRSSIRNGQRNIEVDLSQTTFIDSCGLGALIALHKTACSREGTLRLMNPQPAVQQVLQLTRMHRLFEIVRTASQATAGAEHLTTDAVAAAA
jgi:anti-sigma B factor antagonist